MVKMYKLLIVNVHSDGSETDIQEERYFVNEKEMEQWTKRNKGKLRDELK